MPKRGDIALKSVTEEYFVSGTPSDLDFETCCNMGLSELQDSETYFFRKHR